MNDPSEFDAQNLPGIKNRLIRYYFYLNQGLGIINNFRNLFLGIIAVYFALHWENPLYIAMIFIPSCVVLTVVGFYTVHHINKVNDWLGTRFGSTYGIKTYNYTQGTYEELKKMREFFERLEKEDKVQ